MLAQRLQLPAPRFTFKAPTDWLRSLRALLDAFPQDDLTSTEALCCRVIGDFTSGIVLHRLLYWQSKGIRKDGAIWKSDREWYAELNLSYAQMQRVRNKLAPVVKSWIEKAQGAPTFHYQLRVDALVKGIAAVLNRSTIDIKLTLMQKVENGFSRESRMDFRETQESITNQHQLIDERLNIFNPYLGRFVGFNPEIAAKLADQYARLGEETTRAILERCQTSRGNSWQYVLRALENAPAPSKAPIPLFDEPPAQELTITDEMRAAWNASDEGKAWASRLAAAQTPEAASVLDGTNMKPQVAWKLAYSQLEIQLDRPRFDTWVRGAVFLGYQDGVFQIGVRSAFARDTLQGRFYPDIHRMVSDVLGEKAELRFEVHQPDQQPEDDLPLFKLSLERDAHAAELAFYRRYFNG